MAKGTAAGCGGWMVAGLLLVGMVSQCGKDDPASNATQIRALASAPSAAETPMRWPFVQAASLNCRAGRSTSAVIVEKLSRNDSVGVLKEQDGWALLKRSSNCWVRTSYLGPNPNYQAQKRSSPQRSFSASSYGSSARQTPRRQYDAGSCPCRGNRVCIGPRGGRYCITSGGNKRYGV